MYINRVVTFVMCTYDSGPDALEISNALPFALIRRGHNMN